MFLVEMVRNSYQKLYDTIWGKRKVRILMIGLDAGGKTTMLYRLKLGTESALETVSTQGFNVETIEYKNLSFIVWDIGGPNMQRRLTYKYFDMTDGGVIYVVDATDRDRIPEAKEEMLTTLEKGGCPDTPLLVLANKIDLPNAMSVEEVTEQLDLHSLQRPWHIRATCGTTLDGVYEGFDWLITQLPDQK